MPQQCNNMAGHSNCAIHILRTHLKEKNGCPGGCQTCVSRYKNHDAAVPTRATAFMEDPYLALRYVGHRKNERQRQRSRREKQE